MAAVEQLTPPVMDQELITLPLRALVPADDNPRRDLGDLAELAMSIKSVGIIEPIVATPEAAGRYRVVAGHRRLAAAELAALDEVPVYVRVLDDQERVAAMLVENLQRTDLQPLEEAAAYRRLIDEFGMKQRALAEKVGRSQAHISKRLSLLQLPDEVRGQVDSGGIGIGDAVQLARLGDAGDAIERALRAAESPWRTIEDAVERELERKQRDDEISKLAADAEAEGLRVVAFIQDDDYGHRFTLPKGAHLIQRNPTYGDVLGLDPKKHASEDCHAIAIDPRTKERVPVCTNRRNHPKAKTPNERWREQNQRGRSSSTPSPEQAKRLAEQNELEEAESRRLTFARDLLQRRNAIPKQEMLDMTLACMIGFGLWGDGCEYALSVLGIAEADENGVSISPRNAEELVLEYAGKGASEMLRAAFAFALGEAETNGCNSWGHEWDATAAAYLQLLERHGYEVSTAERKRLPKAAK